MSSQTCFFSFQYSSSVTTSFIINVKNVTFLLNSSYYRTRSSRLVDLDTCFCGEQFLIAFFKNRTFCLQHLNVQFSYESYCSTNVFIKQYENKVENVIISCRKILIIRVCFEIVNIVTDLWKLLFVLE